MPNNPDRCLSSAVLPTQYRDLKQCVLMKHHKTLHMWRETSEGHDRVPLEVQWDDHKCIKIVQGDPGGQED